MVNQLSLPIGLPDDAHFENFLTATESPRAQAINLLQQLVSGQQTFIYLWGGASTGLSHLLQATGNRFSEVGATVQYLPLDQLRDYAPADVLAELEHLDLVCLDQLQTVCGNAQWEQALFNFYNLQRARGGRLLVAADGAPRTLQLNLEDLRSRLASAVIVHLPDYTEAEKIAILQFRAARLGLELVSDAARLMLHRAPRSMVALMDCLKKLDQAALQHQRKPTVHFIKQVFNW